MNKKSGVAISIALIFSGVYSEEYQIIISQERNNYDIIEKNLPIISEWVNVGDVFNCTKEYNSDNYLLSESFNQNETCLQEQERTITTTDLLNGEPKSIVETESKNISVTFSYLENGTREFSSCKSILDSGFSQGDGTYTINISSTEHQVYCDMTTDGGGWTRWWWYYGNGTFPNENDVLGYNFGDADVSSFYGFQTLPSNISKNNTELLAVDGENTILKWDFATGGGTSDSVWNAFTIRTITMRGVVLNNTAWNPSVIQGVITSASQDSFMYREESGVKSFILDDDGCDCATTLSAGANMCGASWNPTYGGEMSYGVDNLKDLECKSTHPSNSMSMFYREK